MSHPSCKRASFILSGALLVLAAPAAEPEEKPADRKALLEVLAEAGLPTLRPGKDVETLPTVPVFAPERIKEYAKGGVDNDFRKAVRKGRAAVWAVAVEAGGGPADFLAEVQLVRQAAGFGLAVLKEGVRAPENENRLKVILVEREREVAKAMGELMDIHDDLMTAGARRNRESRRWQANYDLVRARLELQIAFLFEYQSALGQMRKDLPSRDPKLHGGWVLESKAKLDGDTAGKRLYKSAHQTLDFIIKEHVGTPWEVLARRERDRLIGLEWKAVP